LANLVTVLVVSGSALFIVLWVAHAFVNRRKGVKTSLRGLLIPLILIALVFGGGYLVTRIAPATIGESFRDSPDKLPIFKGLSRWSLALATLVMLLARRQ
jgi:hypothetical protein